MRRCCFDSLDIFVLCEAKEEKTKKVGNDEELLAELKLQGLNEDQALLGKPHIDSLIAHGRAVMYSLLHVFMLFIVARSWKGSAMLCMLARKRASDIECNGHIIVGLRGQVRFRKFRTFQDCILLMKGSRLRSNVFERKTETIQ